MLGALIPERSADDFASGIIRVQLGDSELLLEELPMEPMDAWSAGVDTALADLLAGLDDDEDPADVVRRLAAQRPRVVAALCSYPGMPDEDWVKRNATNSQIIRGLMGVWSAANPLVATVVEMFLALRTRPKLDGNVSELMSTLQRISDGPSVDSAESSPTPSSSHGSTRPTNGSASSTSTGSKRRASGSSSRATHEPTASGSAASGRRVAAPRQRKRQPTSSGQ